ncbi:hypothetical protein [Leucobacter chromiireducens]|uniref:Alternate-type signal peptide domain-containing protein n=1 Tax=Leucobacter chromiireducens subsp. solipictus TaxID=398235 RepID=A0ABS1SIC1_9MICO|nr:hypothetical protein [Leucobacter chromiireducens]MBL3680307.1 hypothetical protein [Leucobacter chromiireducens subsp. solipictus]
MMRGATLRTARRRIQGLSYRTKLTAGIVIAGVGVLSAGTMAYALWNTDTSVSGGTATAGDLDLEYGVGTWQQVTEGVVTPAGGMLVAGTEGFHSMPGDVIEVRVPVTTTLRGDNLNARMNVELGSGAAADLEAGTLAASYRVEDAAHEPVSEETELGQPVTVPGLVGSNTGVTSSWTVVVTVSVLGDYRWTQEDPLLDLDEWALDGVTVTLEQTRSGDGFTTARAAS